MLSFSTVGFLDGFTVQDIKVGKLSCSSYLLKHSNMSTEIFVTKNLRGNYRSYSLHQKTQAVKLAHEHGGRKMAKELKIPWGTLSTWMKKLHAGEGKKPSGRPLSYPPEVDLEICSWILARRDQNLPVSRLMITEYAKKKITVPGFKASAGWLEKFLHRHDLVLRSRTSLAQHLPPDLERRIHIFHRHLQELRTLIEFDDNCIINMDETPLNFDMVPGKTVHPKGSKDVVIRSTGGEKRHITVVLAVSANGDTLPPLVIFKGKRFPKDITTVPDGVHVEMHPRGWMDENLMAKWLAKVVRPYTERKPSLLVLDSFSAHITTSVREEFKRLNITPAIIPGGCTSKVQPLDVSINKPFKTYIRAFWSEYLTNLVDMGQSVKTASRQQVLEWVGAAWERVTERRELIVRSFKVCGISTALNGSEGSLVRNQHHLDDDVEDSTDFVGFTPTDIYSEGEDPFEE